MEVVLILNVLDYTKQQNIDGVLVGSASLDASEFK